MGYNPNFPSEGRYYLNVVSNLHKQVVGHIRDAKFKVTTQIQDQQVRVTGKSRDEAVIAAVRAKDFPVALQFTNFRD